MWLSPSSHEEADSRIMLLVARMVNSGRTDIAIRTVDSDVVVLAISTNNLKTETKAAMAFVWIR